MSLARAQAHAKHIYYCSCGKVVSGNGGKASHEYMHERRGDLHSWIGRVAHAGKFPEMYVDGGLRNEHKAGQSRRRAR